MDQRILLMYTYQTELQIFNGAQLKYIAFISMLIDHVNNALITPFLNGKGFLLHLSNLFSNRFLTSMISPILYYVFPFPFIIILYLPTKLL